MVKPALSHFCSLVPKTSLFRLALIYVTFTCAVLVASVLPILPYLYIALWPCNLPWKVPASQSKPPVSAVTVEYASAASHIPESGAWQMMKRPGHAETEKHLFYVCCSEDACQVPLGHLEDTEYPSTSFFCLTCSLVTWSPLCNTGIVYMLDN